MRSSSDSSNSNNNSRLYFLLVTISFILFGSMYYWQNAPVAQAATQTVSTCDETHLDAAISTASAGDTVNFSCSGIITLTSTINITKDLTLDGNGYNVTLDGGNSVRIINVNSGTNFTFNSLIIAHGNGFGNFGGGIYNSGNITVTNSTFISNKALQGGAIFNGGSIYSISNSTFISNSAFNEGGAISISYSGIVNTLTNSTFISNSSYEGGAIYNNTGGVINNIANTTFTNNTAKYGGGVYNGTSGIISSIANTIFTNNTTTINGGAIANNATIGNITNSIFANNTASYAGAILNGGNGIGNIINTTFTNNTATNSGGAIFNYNNTINSIVNSTFANNSAMAGGAIRNSASAIITNIVNSTFANNTASSGGGAISISSSTLTVTNSIFVQGAGGGNCNGTGITDNGYNLSDDSSCNFSNTSQNQVINLNLGTLSNNGGSTQTVLPGQYSAAIDAIPVGTNGCGTTITTDQRGYSRPQGNGCDVGAVEAQFTPEFLNIDPTADGEVQNVNLEYPAPLTVTVTDNSSGSTVGVSGVQVTFTAPPLDNSPSITFSNGTNIFTITTDTNGNASTGFFYANNISGDFSVTVSVSYPTLNPHLVKPRDITGPVAFGLTNLAPNAVTKLSVTTTSLNFVAGNSSTTSQSLQLKADSLTNWTSSISYGSGANNWLSLDKTSGVVAPLSAQNVGVSVNNAAIKNLADGTYNATVTFADSTNANNKVSVNVSLKVGYGAAYTYFLPYISNNASTSNGNKFLTNVSIQNAGTAPAQIAISYYNQQGGLLSTNNTNSNLAVASSYQPSQELASGESGSATVSSNQPLNILVVENININGKATTSSYSAINAHKDAGATIYAPIALNKAYGDFSTSFVLQNLGGSSTNATISYYTDNGTVAATQAVTLPVQQQVTVEQSAANLPSNFSGWASITSANNQSLAGLVVENSQSNSFMETVGMTAQSSKTLFVPTVFQQAFGNFNTGMQLVNPNGTAANVSVTYYRKDGTKVAASSEHSSFVIGSNSDKAIYHGSGFPELATTNGGFVGTAIVTSDQPLIAVTNQAGSLSGIAFNGTFGTISSGAASVNVPIVVKNSNGYTTGMQVTNVSGVASTATITYYDNSGKAVYSTKLTSDNSSSGGGTIPAYGSSDPYLGAESHLPDSFSGVAIITADTVGAQFVVVANSANSASFYTYSSNS